MMSFSSNSNISIQADPLQQQPGYSDDQRQRLYNFGAKFTNYSSCFNEAALAQHLKFYQVVHRLLTTIDPEFVEKDIVTGHKSPTPAVRVVLARALARFEIWLDAVLFVRESEDTLEINEVPPLDVLMIWHGYLLSPWNYEEDAALRFPVLQKLARFPLEHMVSQAAYSRDAQLK